MLNEGPCTLSTGRRHARTLGARAQLRQAAQDNRRLEKRLAGACDNNRFLDKRTPS